MRTITFLLLLIVALPINAQNSMLLFDGIDDYVYFDAEVGNNIRTIEFWFRPDIDYGPNLSDYAGLVCRERGPGMQNIHEFSIALTPDYMSNPGHMRFSYFISPNEYYDVYSVRNYWDAGQWYHIAGVFHPDFGMMLYVNGQKQPGFVEYYNATASTGDTVAIGTWGFPPPIPDRYFNGAIEDVRFSSNAVYLESFIPQCPDLQATQSTAGLWNMNEGSGYILEDNSENGHTGYIVGATWILDNPCPISINEPGEEGMNEAEVFPIPANEVINIEVNIEGVYTIMLFSNKGERVKERLYGNNDNIISFNTKDLPSGSYYLRIISDEVNITRKVLINH